MTVARIAVFLALALVLAVPLAMRPRRAADDTAAPTLVILTPHVQQIREEFARAFSRWHERHHGSPVRIDWRIPGGTSEIRRQLEAQYTALARSPVARVIDPRPLRAPEREALPEVLLPPDSVGYDLILGGGSYDHQKFKEGVVLELPGPDEKPRRVRVRISRPARFTQDELGSLFGENLVGTSLLYDPDQYWLGTALSSFGIVYNRDELQRLGLPEPASFEDLTDPRLAGLVALADPRQSSSIETSFSAILDNYGWDEGWRILRAMCANTRYFTNSSTKPPQDVSAADAAVGLAIDFYGRGQAESVRRPDETADTSRVGYIDPRGTTYVDADPVTLLAAGTQSHAELAERFVAFCLSEEGQALWQFASRADPRGAANPRGESGDPMGPEVSELRRMPVRRVMYEKYADYFVDKVNPFALASTQKTRGWRDSLKIMMGSFAIDIAEEQRAAWRALNRVKAAEPDSERAKEMEILFFAWPPTTLPDGRILDFTPENYKDIRALWQDRAARDRCRLEYTRFFRDQYAAIVAMEGRSAAAR